MDVPEIEEKRKELEAARAEFESHAWALRNLIDEATPLMATAADPTADKTGISTRLDASVRAQRAAAKRLKAAEKRMKTLEREVRSLERS